MQCDGHCHCFYICAVPLFAARLRVITKSLKHILCASAAVARRAFAVRTGIFAHCLRRFVRAGRSARAVCTYACVRACVRAGRAGARLFY